MAGRRDFTDIVQADTGDPFQLKKIFDTYIAPRGAKNGELDDLISEAYINKRIEHVLAAVVMWHNQYQAMHIYKQYGKCRSFAHPVDVDDIFQELNFAYVSIWRRAKNRGLESLGTNPKYYISACVDRHIKTYLGSERATLNVVKKTNGAARKFAYRAASGGDDDPGGDGLDDEEKARITNAVKLPVFMNATQEGSEETESPIDIPDSSAETSFRRVIEKDTAEDLIGILPSELHRAVFRKYFERIDESGPSAGEPHFSADDIGLDDTKARQLLKEDLEILRSSRQKVMSILGVAVHKEIEIKLNPDEDTEICK